MSTVVQGSPITVSLPAFARLTVSADAVSAGRVVFVGNPGDAPGTPSAIAASGSATFGPYTTVRQYRIVADAGSLSYSMAAIDYPAADEAAAVLKRAVVTGGAAGDMTLAAIAATDTLVAVLLFVGAGVAVTDIVDLTSEFTVAAGKINNTGGTATTGGKLLVLYNHIS